MSKLLLDYSLITYYLPLMHVVLKHERAVIIAVCLSVRVLIASFALLAWLRLFPALVRAIICCFRGMPIGFLLISGGLSPLPCIDDDVACFVCDLFLETEAKASV